jgi:hypothetical protein
MKTFRLLLIGFILSATVVSCEKGTFSKYCSYDVSGKPDQLLVSEEKNELADSLFNTNGIDHSNFVVYQVEYYDHTIVKCYQYVNGLQAFTEQLQFNFDGQGALSYSYGGIINEIDLTTTPVMDPNEVIRIYINIVKEDEILHGFFGRDCIPHCFDLEFGYYDENRWYSDWGPCFVTAWKITPTGISCPVAYIRDDTAEVLQYWDGIIID